MDIFATTYLMMVLTQIKRVPSFFLDRYFRRIETFTTDTIMLDKVIRKARVAPFVNPMLQGKVVETGGFSTQSFKPAYVKPKLVWNPQKTLSRRPGETIGSGSLSPEQRLQAIIASDTQELVEMINARFEIMAAEAVIDGKQTVLGDGFNAVVDYGRTSTHTAALTGADKWDAVDSNGLGTAKIPDQLEDWGDLLKEAGVMGTDLLLDKKAWRLFKNNKYVQKEMDSTNLAARSALIFSPILVEAGVAEFKGTIGNINVIVLSESYVDPTDNVLKNVMSDNLAVLTGPRIEGVRAFGAIMDLDSLQAVEMFMKSYKEEDPSVRYLLAQSAPLMIPANVDGAVKRTVA